MRGSSIAECVENWNSRSLTLQYSAYTLKVLLFHNSSLEYYMSPEDTAICQQGIDLYNAGQKQEAYQIFGDLYDNGNAKDVTLLFWLAYATPDLEEAERALQNIEYLEPTHPKLPDLRKRIGRKQQRLMMRAFPPDKYGPVMACPYCHRMGPARYAKKIAVGGWIWFAACFLLFLGLLAIAMNLGLTFVPTTQLYQVRQEVSSIEGWSFFFLLLSAVGLFIKKHYYTCGYCGIRLGDVT